MRCTYVGILNAHSGRVIKSLGGNLFTTRTTHLLVRAIVTCFIVSGYSRSFRKGYAGGTSAEKEEEEQVRAAVDALAYVCFAYSLISYASLNTTFTGYIRYEAEPSFSNDPV